MWLEKNYKDNKCRVSNQPPWKIVFPFAIWLLWKNRNDVAFKNHGVQSNVYEKVLFNALEFQHCVLIPKISGSKRVVQIRWDKPQSGWFCLNTDGFALGSSGKAGCGGLIRNDQGEWVGGFSRRLGCISSFTAELWGLRDGLILCNSLQLNAVCKVVIYKYVFCWLLFRAKFNCKFIQSFVPCIYCRI